MVATGNEHGDVTVFQIPKNPPDSLPDTLKPKQKKQVERYSISGLHNSAVTTIEWSKNGMKLFSGAGEFFLPESSTFVIVSNVSVFFPAEILADASTAAATASELPGLVQVLPAGEQAVTAVVAQSDGSGEQRNRV